MIFQIIIIRTKLRNPDPDVVKKLGQDPNRHRFMEENNGELFQIELDALQKNPQQFKDLVVDTVNQYYDESIHEKNLKEFTPKKITALINKRVKFLQAVETQLDTLLALAENGMLIPDEILNLMAAIFEQDEKNMKDH
jgi:uncharacterized membrane protein